MSTKKSKLLLDAALAKIPATFRSKLIQTYLSLKTNCAETRHEPAGMAAGKFCEVALRFLQQKVHGSYIPFGKKIDNYADECRKLVVSTSRTGNESERLVMPRALVFLYTMRNKRGIGHIGGDVDANEIDISVMAKTADWLICELIRINHGLSLEEAQDLIDGISVRQLPTIWEVGGKRRVLKEGLTTKQKAALLLYSARDSAVLVEDLCEWIEYSNLSKFKTDVLGELHRERFLEFDKETESVVLSPKGVQYVEENLL